jgi:hypothetical protein
MTAILPAQQNRNNSVRIAGGGNHHHHHHHNRDNNNNNNNNNKGHMALNYWFHPPDANNNFEQPYSTDFWPNDFKNRLA